MCVQYSAERLLQSSQAFEVNIRHQKVGQTPVTVSRPDLILNMGLRLVGLLLLVPLAFSAYIPIIPSTVEEIDQYHHQTNGIHQPRPEGWCGTEHMHPSNGCGSSPCDDSSFVLAYLDEINNHRIDNVALKFRVHYLCNDDGTNCASTATMNSDQLGVFNTGYKPLNLSFTAEAHPINSTRHRVGEMLMCDPSQVGDGSKTAACLSVQTGYDGGDYACATPCTPSDPAVCTIAALAQGACECFCVNTTACTSAMLGDGQCHQECNFKQFNWSNGSCCYQGSVQCRDPESQYRNWYQPDELKALVDDVPTDHFNVYLGPMSASSTLLGYATFPWDDAAQKSGGGLVFNLNNKAWGVFTAQNMLGITALHELGHALGLYHPFHGVTEVSGNTKAAICENACFEHIASWTTGDMVLDTPPTPVNYLCSDPAPCSVAQSTWCSDCNGNSWNGTDFKNYMAYGDDQCLNHFSPHQQGRMRCMIDMYYSNWQDLQTPGPVLFAPTAGYQPADRSVKVEWAYPPYPGKTEVSSFVLERSPAWSSGATVTVSCSPSKASNTTYVDTTVSEGAAYTYRVKSVNGAGSAQFYSASSAAVQVVVSHDCSPQSRVRPRPAVPASGSATVYPTTVNVSAPTTVTIVARSAAGDLIECTATTKAATFEVYWTNAIASGNWSCSNATTFAYTFPAPAVGTKALTVRVPQASTSTSWTTGELTVLLGPIDPASSYFRYEGACWPGRACDLFIHLTDQYSNAYTCSNINLASLSVRLAGAAPNATSCNNDVVTASFPTVGHGTNGAISTQVTYNGAHLSGSPATVDCPMPAFGAISPAKAGTGGLVTITGTGFNSTWAFFGAIESPSCNTTNATSVRCIVPAWGGIRSAVALRLENTWGDYVELAGAFTISAAVGMRPGFVGMLVGLAVALWVAM
ncbi:putative pregnancy-associated plasma protein A; pappalysin 1 [Paratrimastix pyriformis]|uniref:Pregnancy-associated plasma protein A n=1 Tax=Paratrimastix pyriformis TaxID=342808 RepID=A0ABQ8UCF1_9EUKA|nr:putative pregnancy-associated plasma protein A; pappalysin 1 [Paratrimastix pyriformis]